MLCCHEPFALGFFCKTVWNIFISIAQSQSSIYVWVHISSKTEVQVHLKTLLVLAPIIQIPHANIILMCSFLFSAGLHVNVVRWLQPWSVSGRFLMINIHFEYFSFFIKYCMSICIMMRVAWKLHHSVKSVLNQEVSLVSQVQARVLWFTLCTVTALALVLCYLLNS